ncbi:MAG: hypothetical protein WCP21_09130, partial [Armatimonadota bacterium]
MRLSRLVLWLGFALAGVWVSGCGGGSAVPRDSEPMVFEDEDPASGSGQPKVALTPSDYMPLSVGKSWQYQATGGSLTRKLTKTVSSGGQTWYVVEIYQPKVAKVVENWRTSSSAVVLRSAGVTREVLRLPLTVGATWQDAMAHTVIRTNAT